jgi:hypothetical protein
MVLLHEGEKPASHRLFKMLKSSKVERISLNPQTDRIARFSGLLFRSTMRVDNSDEPLASIIACKLSFSKAGLLCIIDELNGKTRKDMKFLKFKKYHLKNLPGSAL